jgi:hypothetical protein
MEALRRSASAFGSSKSLTRETSKSLSQETSNDEASPGRERLQTPEAPPWLTAASRQDSAPMRLMRDDDVQEGDDAEAEPMWLTEASQRVSTLQRSTDEEEEEEEEEEEAEGVEEQDTPSCSPRSSLQSTRISWLYEASAHLEESGKVEGEPHGDEGLGSAPPQPAPAPPAAVEEESSFGPAPTTPAPAPPAPSPAETLLALFGPFLDPMGHCSCRKPQMAKTLSSGWLSGDGPPTAPLKEAAVC